MINFIKRFLLKKIYKSQYRNGHYYSPIPDLKDVQLRENEIFSDSHDIPGIDLQVDKQLSLLKEFEGQKLHSLNSTPIPENLYFSDNGYFNSADAYFLASMMINKKPKKIIEVGSGFSSSLMLDMRQKYFSEALKLTFIEPYPDRLNQILNGKDIEVEIRQQFVQDLNIDLFKKLDKNDFLFIDSSHISKVGSDVNHILFNILPILKKGVIIHFHDITFPFEYPRQWVYDGIFWNEAYILKSFLMYNDNFKIELFNSYIYHFHNQWLKSNIPEYNLEGGSIWIEKQ